MTDFTGKLQRKVLEAEIPKAKQERELELRTPAELVDDWIASIESDSDRPLSTCIPKIDEDLGNKLRGTVGAYIGYGGSKKSLLALQACRHNVMAHKNNCTGVYINMEMAIYQWLSRLMNMTVKGNGMNTSKYMELSYKQYYKIQNKTMMEEVRKTIKKYFVDNYGNNLYVNSQPGIGIQDLHNLVKKAKDKNGLVDMLVIDGLSMMKGVGTETESYTMNSKELKDLAKLHNIYIPLICHLSKGAEKHTREVQRHIRGSEKILDNVDFVIQMSLVVDPERTTSSTTEYKSDQGYIRFYNKRGTGNTVDVVYEFDKTSLLISETNIEPKEVEFDKGNSNDGWS